MKINKKESTLKNFLIVLVAECKYIFTQNMLKL